MTLGTLVLEREQAEKREAESAVAELKRQFAFVKEKCATVDAEIEQYTDEVNNLRKGTSRHPLPYLFPLPRRVASNFLPVNFSF